MNFIKFDDVKYFFRELNLHVSIYEALKVKDINSSSQKILRTIPDNVIKKIINLIGGVALGDEES